MKIYSKERVLMNLEIFKYLPDDILLHIATFLKNKIIFKQLNKFVSNNYHMYLDTKDIISISCYRSNITLIQKYFNNQETQKLIFANIIKNNSMSIFNKLPIDNLFPETYKTIIEKSCVHNSYDIIKKIFDYIKSINFDIIYVKNVFANRYFKLFELLYKLPIVYNAPFHSILIEACALGHTDIVKAMIMNPNINPMYNENMILITTVNNRQYDIVEILLKSGRIDQNLVQYGPFRAALNNNNLAMIKILFTDPNLDINHLNLANMHTLIDNQTIFNYVINSHKINYNFINTCIYAYLINNNTDKIIEIIKHPKFKKNTLYPNYEWDHIIFSKINIDNIRLLDILIDINNMHFINNLLKYIILHFYNNKHLYYNFILILKFILEKVNNNDYILTMILDIFSTNNIEDISKMYTIMKDPSTFFDIVYSLGYYNICKDYIQLPTTNMSELFKKFNQGCYNKISRMFLTYY